MNSADDGDDSLLEDDYLLEIGENSLDMLYGVTEESFASPPPPESGPGTAVRRVVPSPPRRPATPKKRLEIAAGAKIRQDVFPDPQELSFWQDEPAGILYINYCDEATASEILSRGKRDRTARGEGFMEGIKVGHPGSADH